MMNYKWSLAFLLGASMSVVGCGDGDTVTDDSDSETTDSDSDMTDTESDTMTAETFDLTFTGTGYGTAHDGKTVYVSVRDSAGDEVQADTVVVSATQEIDFSWTGILEDGESYTIEWYVDTDDDAMCTHGTDHDWSTPVGPVAGDETVDYPHDTAFVDVCASF